MKITLSKIEYSERLSDESSCFSAVVCLDGVPSFVAENRGQGGETEFRSLPKSGEGFHVGRNPESPLGRLEAYAASLPPKRSNIKDPSDPSGFFVHQPDAESLVDDALNDWLNARDLKRLLARKVLLADQKDGKTEIFTLKCKAADLALHRDAIVKAYPKAIILNSLTFDEALVLYRETSAA